MYHDRTQVRNPGVEDESMSEDTTKNLPGGDRIDALVGLVQTMSTDLRDVKTRLGTLENTVSERLFDTRPIWERALAEIAGTRSELAETRSDVSAIRLEVSQVRSEMNDGFRKLNAKMDVLNQDVLEVRAENRLLGKRVDKLESNSS